MEAERECPLETGASGGLAPACTWAHKASAPEGSRGERRPIALGSLCAVPVLEDIPRTVALLSQGMYMGVLAELQVGGEALNEAWWIYLVTPLPAMLVAALGYVMGVKDIHLTNVNVPELPASDRPTRQELREKRELDKKSRK